MINNWPLSRLLPLATAAFVLVASLTITIVGVGALEKREDAIRQEIGTAFLDAVAGVVGTVGIADRSRPELLEILSSAAAFKPALRNRGLILCCVNDETIDIFTADTAVTTRAALARFISDLEDLGIGDAARENVDGTDEILIAKRYEEGPADQFLLSAAFDLNEVYLSQRQTRQTALLIDFGLALIASALIFVLVRRALKPLNRLTFALSSGATDASLDDIVAGPRTEIGRLREVLRQRIEQQQRLDALADDERDRARNAVLARLSASLAHEVRNPLAGMNAAISTLRRYGEKEEVRKDIADLLERGLASLDRVAAGMLSTYRPASGERTLTPQDILDLELLIRPKLQRKSISLTFASEVDAAFPVNADPVRQIILNLLLNAGEAVAEQGQIGFSAALKDGCLVLEVSDNGPGMPVEAMAVVTQSDSTIIPTQGRLGLWLIHKLLDDIDARLSINTKQGIGTTVKITIPPNEALSGSV